MGKKITKLLLLTVTTMMLFFALAGISRAAQEGIYIYDVTNNEAKIRGFASHAYGNIVIPSTLDAYPVTSIGAYAFAFTGITGVTIPNSVTTIEDNAFNDCDSIISVSIGNGVTSIGNKAFYDCDNLKNITIPDSVTKIGNMAFYDCDNLTSITIGKNVALIGNETFYNCDNLTNVIIPNSVTTIGSKFFYDCDKLTAVTIGNSVTSIGDEAFFDCNSLKNITIPDSVTKIGNNVFFDCDNLTAVTIGDGITKISDATFYSCHKLTTVSIGNNVTAIGDDAFYYCKNLIEVKIPDSVTSVGKRAFYACHNLTTAVIGNSVTSISNKMFDTCINLTSVTLGNSITTIEDSAFSNCKSLTAITIPDSVTSIGASAFRNCIKLTKITIPNSVTTIGEKVFYDCDELTSATIGNSLTYISNMMFFDCNNLTDVIIGNSVTSIRDNAFYNCDRLTSVTIGNSVTEIATSAFSDCNKLTAVIIPDSITKIGEKIFSNCTNLKYIIFAGTEKQWNKISIATNNYDLTICPRYYNATGLATSSYYTYTTPVTGYNNTTIIAVKTTISGDKTIPSAIGGYNVTAIGNYVFRNCNNLTAITIPDGVTTINEYAFSACDNLSSVTIPNSVTKIEYGVFDWCDSLKDIYLAFNNNKWASLGMTEKNDINYHFNVTNVAEHYVSEIITKKATCTTTGEKIMTCECGFDKLSTIPADHTAGNAATCSAAQKCTDCGIVLKEKIPHFYKITTTKATLTKNGTVKTVCTSCGDVKSTKTVSYPKTFTLSTTSYTYNGKVKTPTVTVKDANGKVLTKGTDYTVTYASGRKNIGTYNVTVKMIGNYTGTKTLTFKINPINISTCNVKLSATSVTYNGKVRTPSVTVTNAYDTKLTKDTHYTVTYASDRKNAGTYKITVKMMGNYTGTKTLSFKIKPADISSCTAKLSYISYTYNGKVKTPTVTVTNANGVKLTKDTHYTVTYASGRKNAGTYNVKVTMKGNYTGTKTLSFKINPINISKCTVNLSATSYTYDGKVKAPTVTVKNANGVKLTKGTHYTVTYQAGRKNVGTYKVTIKMIGNYTGTKTLTFKILPPKTTISKLTAGAKKITVNLTKKTTQVTGYQIQYSTSKSFTNAKTVTIANSNTVKATLTGLTANKTYYVRVRTYKTVNNVKYYSGWSAYKYVKTK